ncbi:hypothetical protein HMI54_014425 [Coelomomyces lativittatus]|nr:hypothetical protein HMI55_006324 [Coelomomyces lativittatus]KAJ1514146.1 hypothetical protein HMI54_014425 [Coelomomyces lativittatus]
MLYQRTLPEEIFKLVMGMISNEVKKRQEIYYVVFPPPEMNVRTKEKKLLSNDSSRVLVATRDFEVGEVIYTEEPLIGSLQPSLLSTNKYCHYCFKLIPDTFRPISKRTKLAYCSDPCENIAWEKYDQLMYSDYARSEGSTTHALVQLCTEKDTVIPLFIAKFLAYMVYEDQMKNQQVNQEEFGVWDHLERMKYMDLPMNEKEKKIQKKMQAAVGAKIPGFDEFLTDERYVILKGKFLYNQYSVANGEAENALAKEMQRCALSSAVGVGFYPVSTYLTHSCVPNTRIDFANQDSRLHLIATKPIAAGDQLYVSFVNAEGSYAERKKALSKWRFNCVCEKCTNEELDESRT